jgi:sterol desaturase/sphingolipid hydroxylase (fatty acid hydroxylase superfamily)
MNDTDNILDRFEAFNGPFAALEIVSLIFLAAILIEAAWDIFTAQRKAKETFANFAISIGNALLDRTIFGVVFIAGLVIVESFVSWRLPVNWWSWGLAILAADFTYYWMHRAEHEIRLFWAYHSVHHSSPEYNLTTSMRLSWVEGLFEWMFFIPMILLGFDVIQIIAALLIVVIYQTWIHTERVGKLGWLDRIFNTPSVHRVHHGSNAKYLDKNYGGILIVWDRLFGTYQAEEETVVYGILKPINSINPIKINFIEFWNIGKDIFSSKKVSDGWRYAFGKPGWQPKDTPE